MKTCTHCKKEKPFEAFYKDKKTKKGYMSKCKACLKLIDSPSAKKNRSLKFLYNLSLNQVTEMYMLQEGKCAICNVFKPTYNTHGGLVIDHDHNTGKVRGLLCTNCNVLLGRAQDNIQLLHKAANYLTKYKKESLTCESQAN